MGMNTRRFWIGIVLTLLFAGVLSPVVKSSAAPPAQDGPGDEPPVRLVAHPGQPPQADWGTWMAAPGRTTTYDIFAENYVYGEQPYLITDLRSDSLDSSKYLDKESYEIRNLTVYRAFDGENYLENQPVIFFLHGGGWVDAYAGWYNYIAQSLTGEMGWVTVMVDFPLSSDQVFLADQYCPDRVTCNLPQNLPLRTKSAWFPEMISAVGQAFQWVWNHSPEFGGSRDMIVVFGHSSGANLASLLASAPQFNALRPAMKAVIGLGGVYAVDELDMAFFSPYIDQTWMGGSVDNSHELQAASAATYFDSTAYLPLFYLLESQVELVSLHEQTLNFRGRLLSRGIPVQYDFLLGYDHNAEITAFQDIYTTPAQLVTKYILKAVQPFRLGLPLVVNTVN